MSDMQQIAPTDIRYDFFALMASISVEYHFFVLKKTG